MDPTLLLSKQEWNDLIGKYENENEKYILAYTMDNNQKYFDIVNNLSDQTGYKVVYFDLRNKGFKNIYKNVDPPSSEKVTDPYTNNITKTKKKKKKKKR